MSAKARQSLTSRIRGMIVDVLTELAVPVTVHGVVTGSTTGPAALSVQIQGTTEIITGIRYPPWYTPNIGDTIIMHRVGGTDQYMTQLIKP